MPIVLPEQWRKYPKNELYEISDQGRVRRKHKNKTTYLKPISNGYTLGVAILPGNKKTSLARAVWETFRGPIPEGYIVIYKNGCNSMPDLYNLDIMEQRKFKSEQLAKRNVDRAIKVKDNDTGVIYKSMRQAEKSLFVANGVIRDILLGNTKNSRTGLNISIYKEVE